MSKWSFEKAVIFTIILIILISTANIYSQFLYMRLPHGDKAAANMNPWDASRSISALVNADKLYSQGKYLEAQGKYQEEQGKYQEAQGKYLEAQTKYQEAIDEYIKLLITDSLSREQKAYAYFMRGMCQYILKQYSKAQDSFSSSVIYEPNSAAAYNNAAVSAFNAKDYASALEYEKEAVKVLPSVEYYYNLGRIYESLSMYELAAESFISVVKGSENATLVDPVRVYNRVANLIPDLKERQEIEKGVVVSSKLRNYREVLTIEFTDTEVLGTDFKVAVYNEGEGKVLRVVYDRDKEDPYHYINSISWKVESGSNVLYKGSRNSFKMGVFENNNYKITFTIKYKGSSVKERMTYIQVTDKGFKEYKGVETLKPNQQHSIIYENAAYEQLFDKNFNLTTRGYYDRFNVMWTKDDIDSRIMTVDFRDSGSSLLLYNNSNKDGGIRANFTTLLGDKNLRGKKLSIRFMARKITTEESTVVNVRVGKENYQFKNFDLQYKWKQVSMDFDIPQNANNFTFSLNIKPDEKIKIDGFIIVVK